MTLSLLLAFAATAAAQQPQQPQQPPDARSAILVSSAWLADHLKDPELVLLHVGDKAEYDAGHLPGARFVALRDISVSDRTNPNGLTLEVPSDLRDRLANLGIGDKSRVVVYYGNDWISPSTRVMFILDYAGLGAQSALLEGGMQQWKREGRVVDSRDTVFFSGTRTGGRPGAEHRTGHIAGARSVYFGSLFDDQNFLKPAKDLAALFAAAGVQPGDTVVTYCHIGQQATATIFAARSLGHPVLLYDGSFEDWSRKTGFPVEKSP